MREFDQELIWEYARSIKLPTALVEKDYVLSVVLLSISKFPEADDLVFKGGTALRKAYFADYRLSADLDFTGVSDIKLKLKDSLSDIQNKEIEGVSFLELSDKTMKGFNSLNLVLQYKSKIGTTPNKKHIDNIKLDFNFDNIVYLKPEKIKVVSPKEFSLEEFEINTMQIEEIICEKIHAIHKRPKPRDLYDFHNLLKRGYKINIDLADKKLSSLAVRFEIEGFSKHVEKLRAKWEIDMKGLLPFVPDFDIIAREALEFVKKQLQG
ncbi:MAG TPA: nucleotidyl transferase AbiEii/AbiGii toxin family protein [Candidatus Bilamarchaeaceae archaeon]|nr:nucleotidyl transferase AbiEii/AbiGii toxin family protein [Candidatus Bilamarchaeaceae archaeon]